jgi:hypothetical protein
LRLFIILAITFASRKSSSPKTQKKKIIITLLKRRILKKKKVFVITLCIILIFLKIRQTRAEKKRDEHRRRTAQFQEMYRGGTGLSWKQQQQRQRQSDESILLTMPVLAKTKTPWKTTRQTPMPPMMSDLGYPGMTFANAV